MIFLLNLFEKAFEIFWCPLDYSSYHSIMILLQMELRQNTTPYGTCACNCTYTWLGVHTFMYLRFPDQNKFTQYQIVWIPSFQTLSEGGNQCLKVRCLILLDISTIIYIFRCSTMIFYVYNILFLLNMHKTRYFVHLFVQNYLGIAEIAPFAYGSIVHRLKLVTLTKIACLFLQKFLWHNIDQNSMFIFTEIS